jgi:putative transposase
MLTPAKMYHIYNRANGRERLFIEEENYGFFLQRVTKFILPIAEIYAYCLLPNHFHFLLRIKTIEESIRFYEGILNSIQTAPEAKFDLEAIAKRLKEFKIQGNEMELYQTFISKQFSNLFSSYTQSFNKKYERKGSLFLKNFKRKEIDSTEYLLTAINYIHRNPIHHGIVNHFKLWKWSSYQAYISCQQTSVGKDDILKLVGSIDEFVKMHEAELGVELVCDFELD